MAVVVLLAIGHFDLSPAQSESDQESSHRQSAVDSRTAARVVDELFQQDAVANGQIQKSPRATRVDDYTFLRRASFDLAGRPPTVLQIERFASDDSPRKREALVDALLADGQYGENWARYWRDVILMRRTEPRAGIVTAALETFLSDAFNANRPWDEIARDFITAEGDIVQNGATAIIAAQGGQPEETVAELSRIFLGIQIQCAQCHDHPTDVWTREQFHELAAFYPRVFMRPNPGADRRSFLVTYRDSPRRFRPNVDRYLGELEHYMSDLDDPSADGTLMEPGFFVSGERLPVGISDQQRREALSEWFTEPANIWFAKAFVNRVSAELIGRGFYEPIDDLGPDREVVAVEALNYLTDQFLVHGYDIKWLYRTIMFTSVYQSAVVPRDPDRRTSFVNTHPQRLRADQVFYSLENVVQFHLPNLPRRQRNESRRGPQAVFRQTFAFDPSEPRQDVVGSIPQALMMMNGDILDRALSARPGSRFDGLAKSGSQDGELIRQLYLVTLSRPPTKREQKIHQSYLRRAPKRNDAVEDIVWALVNSSEFFYRG